MSSLLVGKKWQPPAKKRELSDSDDEDSDSSEDLFSGKAAGKGKSPRGAAPKSKHRKVDKAIDSSDDEGKNDDGSFFDDGDNDDDEDGDKEDREKRIQDKVNALLENSASSCSSNTNFIDSTIVDEKPPTSAEKRRSRKNQANLNRARELVAKVDSKQKQSINNYEVDMIDLDIEDNIARPVFGKIMTAAERLKQAPVFSLDLLESELGIKSNNPSRAADINQPVDVTNKGVKLKTRLNGKHEAKWIVVQDDVFGKLKDKFANLYKISIDDIKKFEFDGEELDNNETPLDQDMEDGDLIDAKIDAALLEDALAAAVKPKTQQAPAVTPSSSSSSSSSSAQNFPEEKVKSIALAPENRLQQTIKLKVLAQVSKSAKEINTELKVFGDFTLAKIHLMLSKADTGIFNREMTLPSYTIERAQGGSKLLSMDEEIINLDIDNEIIIVRPSNIGIVILPKIKNSQKVNVEQFGVNVSPLTSISRFIDSLVASGYLIHPRDMLKFNLASQEVAKKKGAKPKKKLIDLKGFDENTSLFDCGFTDGAVLECSKI